MKKGNDLISCKKGNVVFDMIIFIIVLLVFTMITFFGWQAFSEVNIDIQNDLTLNESIQTMEEVETRYPSVMDGMIMIILVGLWVAGIVFALMSNQHPLLFGFLMILVVFVLISAAMFANYFEETFEDPELSGLSADFPISVWVMTHLMEVTLVVAISIVLALLGKNKV